MKRGCDDVVAVAQAVSLGPHLAAVGYRAWSWIDSMVRATPKSSLSRMTQAVRRSHPDGTAPSWNEYPLPCSEPSSTP
jgi:hypothetical protein